MVTRKPKVDITEDSLKELMQEAYNEIVDERNRALSAYKKIQKDVEELTDVALVGKITNDLLKIIDASIDKKLRLIKLQSDIIYKGGKSVGIPTDRDLTAEDKKLIQSMIRGSKSSEEMSSKKYD
jgi:hypothetical protein